MNFWKKKNSEVPSTGSGVLSKKKSPPMLSEVEIRICLLPDVDFRFDKLLDVELQNMSQFLEVEI